jgi:hypothetical protein
MLIPALKHWAIAKRGEETYVPARRIRACTSVFSLCHERKESLSTGAAAHKMAITVCERLQRGSDEWLLLRARYIQLISALDQTPKWNSATLAALGQILPASELRGKSIENRTTLVSWPLKEAADQRRIAA